MFDFLRRKGIATAKKRKGKVWVGTSGWQYRHWKGPFYPEDVPARQWFDFYVERFQSVELNNSFYRLPEEATFRSWRDRAPNSFQFAVKASRYITHMKKLKDPKRSCRKFFKRIEALGDSLGVVLFQLPPHWGCNPERLEAFLQALPGGNRYAFEFRDVSWFCGEVSNILQRYGAAFCIYELAGVQSPRTVTADFVYIRLHGNARVKYHGRYDLQTLGGWAGAITVWRRQGRDVYCYFDNDYKGYAAINAGELRNML